MIFSFKFPMRKYGDNISWDSSRGKPQDVEIRHTFSFEGDKPCPPPPRTDKILSGGDNCFFGHTSPFIYWYN